jgi:hypothetical protein
MNRLLLCLGFATLFAAPIGCAHVDRARADYHERRAHRAADQGHFGEALREDRKADRAEDQARHDPLP